MKEKIIYLIIGILIGAILASGCFLIFGQNSNNAQGQMPQNMRQMDGNMTGGPGGGTPPSGGNTTGGAPSSTSGNTTTTNNT